MNSDWPNADAKAWRLPDPPTGMEWHRTDWTHDMLPDGWRPLLLHEERGDGDMYYSNARKAWRLTESAGDPVGLGSLLTRTQRPLPKPAAKVDLGPEDVPPGSAIRRIGAHLWRLVSSVTSVGVYAMDDFFTWSQLRGLFEISRDNGASWKRCEKEEVS